MNNSEFILKSKRKLSSLIIRNDSLLRYIDNKLVNDPDIAMYNNIFPYIRVPDTEEEVSTYICYDVSMDRPNFQNNTARLVITIYIITHQQLMKIKPDENLATGGTRIDLMSSLFDNMLEGNENFGFGELKCLSNVPENVDTRHRARVLTYVTESLNVRSCGIVE